MSRLNWHLTVIAIIGAIMTSGGLWFLSSVSPETASFSLLTAVYSGIFLWVLAASWLAGFGIRLIIWPRGGKPEFYKSARRQSVLFAFLTISLLLLQALNVLNILTGGLLMLIFLLIDLYTQ